jgi:hypothetical protein
MRKIMLSLISVSLIISVSSLVANADAAYSRFKKSQMAEFDGDKAPLNCPEKKLEATESGNKFLYELCAVKGKPIYIRASSDGVTYGFYAFKNGKVIQITAVDAFISSGFRNEQPVVEWDFGNETVNFKPSAETKTQLRQDVVKIKKILNKFGIR